MSPVIAIPAPRHITMTALIRGNARATRPADPPTRGTRTMPPRREPSLDDEIGLVGARGFEAWVTGRSGDAGSRWAVAVSPPHRPLSLIRAREAMPTSPRRAADVARAGPQRITHLPSRRPAGPPARATDRAVGVVAAVLVAGSEKGAAHRLGLSHSTVKHHLANARSKVGAATTAQLVWVLASRLPEPESVVQTDG